MESKAALPVEEYLRTSFPDLDKEYRDGELVERSLPDYLHSKTQGLLIVLLSALRKAFPVLCVRSCGCGFAQGYIGSRTSLCFIRRSRKDVYPTLRRWLPLKSYPSMTR